MTNSQLLGSTYSSTQERPRTTQLSVLGSTSAAMYPGSHDQQHLFQQGLGQQGLQQQVNINQTHAAIDRSKRRRRCAQEERGVVRVCVLLCSTGQALSAHGPVFFSACTPDCVILSLRLPARGRASATSFSALIIYLFSAACLYWWWWPRAPHTALLPPPR